MAYAVAAKRLDRKLHRIIYAKKSKTYDHKLKAELALKRMQKSHPAEEYAIIDI